MQSVLLNIQQSRSDLTKTEQTIADYILKNPHLVIKDSVQELASKIPTSPASVVRFSQKFCGDGGFSELKIRISAESGLETELYKELSPNDSFEELEKKLSFRINQSISKTSDILEESSLDQAVKLLENHETILVFGIGASALAAKDLQQKFLRIGKTVLVMEDVHLLSTTLLGHPSSTALILISNSGETAEIISSASLAKEQGVPLIAITQASQNTLNYLADIKLETDNSTENVHLRSAATTSLIAQLYTVDLLYYRFFANSYDNNAKLISASQKFIMNNFRR